MSDEAGAQLADAIGATGLKGAGALGLYWLAAPTLQAVGKAFGDWTEFRLRNLLRLGEKIQARRGDNDADEGEVHPRVLHEVFDRGSWTSDEVAQEYLAGILYSSRSKSGDDEEGAYLASIVAGMTSSQIRLHHAIYYPLNGHGAVTNEGLHVQETSKALNVYVPHDQMYAMIGKAEGDVDGWNTLRAATGALARERLIGNEYGLGGPDAPYLQQAFPPGARGGLLAYPTVLGIELFLRAYGIKLQTHNDLLAGVKLPAVEGQMPVPSNTRVGAGRL